jgi:hypothetical protein
LAFAAHDLCGGRSNPETQQDNNMISWDCWGFIVMVLDVALVRTTKWMMITKRKRSFTF